jgi:WD40 repeat protein
LTELQGLGIDGGTLQSVLDSFAKHRLLTLDRDPESREPTVEVAHEALLGRWERLRTWIDDRRDDLVLHRRLVASVDEWRASGGQSEYLLTGGRLDHFESLAAETDLAIGAEESAYLAESRRHADELDARRRRRRQSIMAGFALAAVIAAVFALVANQQRHRAEVEASLNRSRVLAAAALDAIGEDDQLALLLGLEAADVSTAADGEILPEAADALHRSLSASRLIAAVSLDELPLGRSVTLAASSSGLVAVSSTGDTVELRHGDDLATVVATLGAPLEGADTGHASSPSFTADGTSVAVVGSDGTVRVWDVESGTEIWSQPRRSPGRGGVVYSPDGTRLLSAGYATLVVWDAASGREIWSTSVLGGLDAIPAFSPDGTRIAVGTWGSAELAVLDAESGEELSKLGTPTGVGSLLWSPDGAQLLVGQIAGHIHVVDTAALGVVETWEDAVIATLAGHTSIPLCMTIDSSGTRLATGADDGTVRIWDLATGGELMVLGAGAGTIDGVAFLPGDQHVVATGNDRLLRRYDISPEGRGEVFAAHTRGEELASIDISPDGTKLASLAFWGEWNPAGVTIWDIATGSPQLAIDGLDWFSFGGVTFTNDGQGFVVQDWDETQEAIDPVGVGWGPVQLRDAITGRVVMSFAETEGQERQTPVFSRNGSVFATGSTGAWADFEKEQPTSTASIHDAATGELQHRLDHGDWAVSAVALSSSGDRLATATCDRGIVTLWDVASEAVLWSTEYPGCSTRIALSPDGSFVAASSLDSPPTVWDAATGEKWFDVAGHNGGAWSITVGPDGSTVASAGTDGSVLVVDSGTGEPLTAIQVSDQSIGDVEYSPDGETLAVATLDGFLYVFALDSDRLVDLARSRTLRTFTQAECASYDIDPCPASLE